MGGCGAGGAGLPGSNVGVGPPAVCGVVGGCGAGGVVLVEGGAGGNGGSGGAGGVVVSVAGGSDASSIGDGPEF